MAHKWRLALVFIFVLSCFGSELSEYERAQAYERAGDIENALKIYKELAAKAVNTLPNKASTDKSNLNQSEQNAKAKDGDFGEVFKDSGVSLHELNYLLFGTHDFSAIDDGRRRFETKFNISIKKPLELPFLGDNKQFYLAYSQTSWWQTAKASAPFRESNYRPEAFLRFGFDREYLKALKLGLLHESNGLGGNTSRSWNRIYASADFSFGALSLTPRIWQSIAGLGDNPDIKRYLGYGDLRARYDSGSWAIDLLWRNNLRFKHNKGAIELGLIFPIFSGFYGYIQYFNGYGESLIDYNRSTSKIGLGISILR